MVSDEQVKENRGMVALERGPILFCIEGIDNNGRTSNIVLPDESKLSERYIKNLLGGISVIEGANLTAIPYFAWLNRGEGEMDVWIPRDIAALRNRNY